MDIEHVDLSIDENNLCEGALKLLKIIRHEWNENDINCEVGLVTKKYFHIF